MTDQVEPQEESLFDLLSNEDMDVIANQVVALAETIRGVYASFDPNNSGSMNYNADAVRLWTTVFQGVLLMNEQAAAGIAAAINEGEVLDGTD